MTNEVIDNHSIFSAGPDKTGSDEDWLRRTAAGNADCFEPLVRRYSAGLYRFLYSRVRSPQDAEDLCQETFLKAYRALDTFDMRSSFKTWLFTIAYHELVSFLRKKKLPTRSNLEHLDGPAPREQTAAFAAEEIWTAAQCLKPDQYSLLWLRYKENLSIPELAVITGKNRLHIRVLLHRARRKLASLLIAKTESPRLPGRPPTEATCFLQGESHVL